MSTENTENTEKIGFFPVLLSVHFLFFLYAFHAAISIRYWFAIDIAIRYRYRSYRAFSIASSDIDIDSDSDSERTTATGCGSAALCSSWINIRERHPVTNWEARR
uniref:Uncharacterized protein n=3 Tax=Candidatus Kentrum sp. FM TaxID=2126340 RepID=A0A450S7P4_9GAMM|nr:MAG: hypothetical protein BECKFM1743C_GA0114222_100522 [Candidatus Kentron sp. FM]VFK07899.1 MAG: hypothetical protein BECKFM1743B_GA0114221_100532 [Candidatus Kentron sp. FM]